jgi:type I restriction enzyme R subunit
MTDLASKETAFEASIEKHLACHGWLTASPKGFDREQLLQPAEFLAFVEATQPNELAKLAKTAGGDQAARTSLLTRLVQELDAHGTLYVLRRGFKDRGVQFQAAFFRPAHGLTPDLVTRYEANRCTLVRQLIYSNKTSKELDLALLVNGLLVATAELKNPLTGQSVEDAKKQYRTDRDPKHRALSQRALVHFAVDPDLVFITTRLAGGDTIFLPFNRGDANGGAGNPPHPSGHATAYLWEEVWQRDAWLELLQRFVHYEGEPSNSKPRPLLFPRYHQWDAVRTLRGLARSDGPGENYLVQHSAGSGKSNTIGWLAHQLASLYADDQKVFDKVVVITDRRVLDKQLRDTVFQFDHTPGVVQRIEKHSGELADALKNPGAQIIITTLQKFPFVIREVADLPSATYAIVVDEAHSSQTGETAKDLKSALGAAKKSEEAELAHAEQQDVLTEQDSEDFVAQSVADRGQQPNLSYFAFTATPKQKTLQLFGIKNSDGDLVPVHIYSMRQAIEEGFILDVLRNYSTYKTYWRLAKEVADDPDVDRAKAAKALARFVSLHPYNLAQKAEVIVEHFRRSTRHKLDGHAKAMVVTRSRLHAVRYKQAVDAYIQDKGYEDLHTLVAFSGKVIDENQLSYTEVEMNSGLSEGKLPEAFKSDDYQLLIVAEKYQTGYDEPLLHTMYVDKKLEGVKAVQTLSRLNRTIVGKDDTFVLDFANDTETIQKAFAPFYETTIAEPTEVNAVYDAQGEVENYQVIVEQEMTDFVAALAKHAGDETKNGLLYKLLDPARQRFLDLPETNQDGFRASLTSFLRLYAFLAQCVPFADTDLESLYLYGRFLATRLRRDHEPGLDVSSDVVLTHLRMEGQAIADLSLTAEGKLKGFTGEMVRSDPDVAPLSEIIQVLNDRFGAEFTGADKLYFEQLVEATVEDEELKQQAKVNDLDNWQYAFKRKFNGIVVDRRGANEELFERFLADPEFAETISEWVMHQSYEQFRESYERGPASEIE